MKPKKKRLPKDDELVGKKLKNLLAQEETVMLKSLFTEAVILAIKENRRFMPAGLETVGPPMGGEIQAMSEAMLPLMIAIKKQSAASFFRVLSGILNDKTLKEAMTHGFSSSVGKTGGRPLGSRAPYIEWLECVVLLQEEKYAGLERFTAAQHHEELLLHKDIDGTDKAGNPVFNKMFIEESGWDKDTPAITLNAVREALTKARKQS